MQIILAAVTSGFLVKVLDVLISAQAQARKARREAELEPETELQAARASRIWWMEHAANARAAAAQAGIPLSPLDLRADPYPPKWTIQ